MSITKADLTRIRTEHRTIHKKNHQNNHLIGEWRTCQEEPCVSAKALDDKMSALIDQQDHRAVKRDKP